MKAIIRKIFIKNVQTKAGQKFDKVCFECDCIDENSNVKSRTAEMSVEYAKAYFNHCGVSSKEAIGMEVEVTLQKRAFEDRNGELRTFESIKYLNLLDEDGNPIIMFKEKVDSDLPF